MYNIFRQACERLLRIPHDPAPPPGDEASTRIFRAAPNYYRYLLFLWGLKSGAGIVIVAVALGIPMVGLCLELGRKGDPWAPLLLLIPVLVLVPLAIVCALLVGSLLVPMVRRRLYSGPVFAFYRKILPPMSDTEREALEAGTLGRTSSIEHLAAPGWAGERLAHDSAKSPSVRGRVARGLLGEGLEEGLDQQHHENVLGHDHAGRLFVGEAGLEGIAQRGEEGDRAGQVLHGQVDEDLRAHRTLLSFTSGGRHRRAPAADPRTASAPAAGRNCDRLHGCGHPVSRRTRPATRSDPAPFTNAYRPNNSSRSFQVFPAKGMWVDFVPEPGTGYALAIYSLSPFVTSPNLEISLRNRK